MCVRDLPKRIFNGKLSVEIMTRDGNSEISMV